MQSWDSSSNRQQKKRTKTTLKNRVAKSPARPQPARHTRKHRFPSPIHHKNTNLSPPPIASFLVIFPSCLLTCPPGCRCTESLRRSASRRGTTRGPSSTGPRAWRRRGRRGTSPLWGRPATASARPTRSSRTPRGMHVLYARCDDGG